MAKAKAGRRAPSGCRRSTGHGNFPYLCGNLDDVVVSPLLYTCYQNSQSAARAYEQRGACASQPISQETQLLLTVYYLVQLGESPSPSVGAPGRALPAGGMRVSLRRWPPPTGSGGRGVNYGGQSLWR